MLHSTQNDLDHFYDGERPVIRCIRFNPGWDRNCRPGTRWELSYINNWGNPVFDCFDSIEDVQAAAAQMATDEREFQLRCDELEDRLIGGCR